MPLRAIGQDVYYVARQQDQNTTIGPRFIILCTRLGGATAPRVQEYLDGYKSLYPNSSILLITARCLEIIALPFSFLHAWLAPARQVMAEHIEANGAQPSILWHIFSYGGCNSAIQAALSLRSQRSSDIDLSKYVKLFIFDCCPGDATFENPYKAAIYSLPDSFPARVVGQVLLCPTIELITGLQN